MKVREGMIRPKRGIMTHACSAPGCRNGYFIRVPEPEIYKNKKFFKFPLNVHLRNKWIAVSGCSNVNNFSSLCEDHFDKTDYGRYDNSCLFKGVVPKYFLQSGHSKNIESNIEFQNVEGSDCMESDPVSYVDSEPSSSVNPPNDVATCSDSVVSPMSVCRVCVQDGAGREMFPLVSAVIDNDSNVIIMDMINAVSCIEAKSSDGLPTEVCLECLKRIVSAYQLKRQCESSNIMLREMLEKNNLENEEQKIEVTCKKSTISFNKQSRKIFCRDCNVSMFKSEIRMHMATCKMKIRAAYLTPNQKKLVICQNCNCLCYSYEMRAHRKFCKKLKLNEQISEDVLDENGDDQSSVDRYYQKDFVDDAKINLKQSEKHVTEKLYSCSYCEESYDQYVALRAHLTKVHPTSRKRLCTICGKMIPNPSWRLHQNRHTQFKPHTCELCNKKFYSTQILRTHLRTHTREKPYRCSQCPKRFNVKVSLKYHIRTHTGERPHVCIICDKRFVALQNMRSHMKLHKVINNEAENTEAAAKVNTIHQAGQSTL